MSRLIMTLLVRDEVDIVRDNIDFHLEHGVDYVVATDNGSVDGTRELLADYEKSGQLHLIDEPRQDYSQGEWVTRMALLARDRFGADWILNNDADEFWYPSSGDLKSALDDTASHMLVCDRKNMVFPCEGPRSAHWSVDLVYRATEPFPMPSKERRMSPTLPHPYFYFKLPAKVLCRAQGLRSIAQGNHDASYDGAPTREAGERIEIFHFPIRSFEQFMRKIGQGGAAYERNTKLGPGVGWHWRRWFEMFKRGEHERAFREALPSEGALRRDLANGVATIDRRIEAAFAERARGEAGSESGTAQQA